MGSKAGLLPAVQCQCHWLHSSRFVQPAQAHADIPDCLHECTYGALCCVNSIVVQKLTCSLCHLSSGRWRACSTTTSVWVWMLERPMGSTTCGRPGLGPPPPGSSIRPGTPTLAAPPAGSAVPRPSTPLPPSRYARLWLCLCLAVICLMLVCGLC